MENKLIAVVKLLKDLGYKSFTENGLCESEFANHYKIWVRNERNVLTLQTMDKSYRTTHTARATGKLTVIYHEEFSEAVAWIISNSKH